MPVLNINTKFEVDEACYLIWDNKLAVATIDQILIKRTTGPVSDIKYLISIGPVQPVKEFTESELFLTIQLVKDSL